uniref:Uncharacterized protein n=1 Tax=Arundo donax TaxID=35708 RepID=A0A0A9B5T3_ARUDO
MLGAGDSSAAANRSGARGRRRTATAGKGKRSGLGCCENSAIN